MIDIVDYKNCVLCKACSNICPTNAIEFKKEKNSFEYPEIDQKKCINCNLCEKSCPVLKKQKSNSLKECYAVKHTDEKIRIHSTSGGAFSILAEEIINNGGYVCGCTLDDNFNSIHIIINKLEDIQLLKGSKYIQSDIGLIYREIKKLLNKSIKVLFVGSPCQISGLKTFLGKEYEELLCVDFICHGILSQSYFNQYREFLQNKYNSKVDKISFRNKKHGWHCSSFTAEFKNGDVYDNPITVDPYMKTLLNNFFVKDSCQNCQFRNFTSGSDITLGDFWGIEVIDKNFDDNKGVSAVIINSLKGKKYFDNVILEKKNVRYESILTYNMSLEFSSKANLYRDEFINLYEKYGFEYVYNKFLKEDKKEKALRVKQELINSLYKIFFKKKRNIYYK